ncbi:MAG TPA: AI-2E family transporter [Candidatus Sulfomarinibacteraceae bacterium]|nr:AI-2E family transporter [Candidatus Sulfomarinibacteraceae bacterium]
MTDDMAQDATAQESIELQPTADTQGHWWARASATAAAIILGLGALWAIDLFAWPLALLVGGVALAAALAPVVDRLGNFMPRAVAVILIYLLFVLILAGLSWLVLPTVITQGQQAVEELPEMMESAQERMDRWIPLDGASLRDIVTSGVRSFSSTLLSFPQRVTRSAVHVAVIFFLSIYLLILAPAAIEFALSLFPRRSRPRLQRLFSAMGSAMGGYVRGVFINSVLVGILTYIGLLIIGLEFALVLAVISGVLEIIPVVGPFVAGVIMVGAALIQAPDKVMIVAIFAIVLQQVESNIIVPNIMKGQAKLSPVLTILALVAGERLGGVIGALIAIPLVAAARVVVVQVVAPAVRQRTGAAADQTAESE